MNKIIKISESQLKSVINKSLNEEVEGNIAMSVGNTIINGILKGGILYDEKCIDSINEPTLKANAGPYTIYIIGHTDSKPHIGTPYNPGDYNTPPEGGDVIWEPKKFYPSYVYGIFNQGKDIDEEYTEAIGEYIIEKLPEINLDNNYEIVINKEDFDDEDDFDIDPYDNKNF